MTPSIYGVEKCVLIKSLRDAGPHGRGVAVPNAHATVRTVSDLRDVGVRGARFNLAQRGTTAVEMMQAVAERVAPFGWHVQLHASQSELLELEHRLGTLPAELVFDHIACVGEDERLQPDVERCLHRLLDSGRVWLKLSAPYFFARGGADSYDHIASMLETVVGLHSERLLWGSDWPHGTQLEKPEDAATLDFLLRSAKPSQVHRILVHNPVVVYGFDSFDA